jgi:hypothetical protein
MPTLNDPIRIGDLELPSASGCLALLLIFLMAALVQSLHQLTQEGRTGDGR